MNFWATFHADVGKRMFFSASSRPEIVSPVGFAFSAGALLLLPPPSPALVAMTAMIPAASTTAASTKSQRLNRREDRAFWTTFTAIMSVDEKPASELED